MKKLLSITVIAYRTFYFIVYKIVNFMKVVNFALKVMNDVL